MGKGKEDHKSGDIIARGLAEIYDDTVLEYDEMIHDTARTLHYSAQRT